MIQVSSLRCGYEGKVVISDLSLAVSPGERIALVGPNGCGKSTLIAAISGLIKPISGEILLQSDSLARLKTKEIARRVAVLPQREAFAFPFLSREIVAMGRFCHAQNITESAEDHAAIDAAMAATNVTQFATRPITQLSGGEAQRVLLARAIAQASPIMLLDEPNTGLDPRYQAEFVHLLEQENFREKTIIAALHDLNLAGAVSNRMIVMKAGEIIADGETRAILGGSDIEKAYETKFRRLEIDGRLVVMPYL